MRWQSSQGTTVRENQAVQACDSNTSPPLAVSLVYCRHGPWHVTAQAPNLPSLTTRTSTRIRSEIPMYYTPNYEDMIELRTISCSGFGAQQKWKRKLLNRLMYNEICCPCMATEQNHAFVCVLEQKCKAKFQTSRAADAARRTVIV